MTEGPEQGQEPDYGSQPQPYGRPPQEPYGQPPSGQPPSYSQPPSGQPPAYGQPPQYGQAPYGQTPYGQTPYGQAPPYSQPPYPQQYPAPPYGGAWGAPPGIGLPPGVRLASYGQRAAALLLDALFGFLLAIPGIVLIIIGVVRAEDRGSFDGVSTTLIVLGALLEVAAVIVQLWNQGWRQGAQGWSWGKQVLRIKLLRIADGQPPSGGVGLGRLLVRGLLGGVTGGVYTVLTYLWPLWDERRQTLDDKIFSTIVAEA